MHTQTHKGQICLLTGLCLSLFLVWLSNPASAEMVFTNDFTVPSEGRPFGIVADPMPDRYWVINQFVGLILINKDQAGNWQMIPYNIGPVYDVCGPDNFGNLYCTYDSDAPLDTGVYRFNCYSEEVEGIYPMPASNRYSLTGLTMSEDKNFLFVCAWTRFRFAQPNGAGAVSTRDDLVLEGDISTGELVSTERSAVVHAYPETIICSGDFVAVCVNSTFRDPITDSERSAIQFISRDDFSVVGQPLLCNWVANEYMNELLDWHGYVAVVAPTLDYIPGDPVIKDTIWILDPASQSRIGSVRVVDNHGHEAGAVKACLSGVYDDILYASIDSGWFERDGHFLITNAQGQYIDFITTPQGFQVWFIYETPDGTLIVSGGPSNRIGIVEGSPYHDQPF